ncbi:MAG: SulP family inorganic anion transporter [Acetobacteraceae bacterium]|nr:SulP family inorganic anion transporter [Acetobacteraceae bacterium]
MTVQHKTHRLRLPVMQGILPIAASQVPADIVAGITLATLAIPEVMGYAKIAQTPVITGLYTILVPTVLFALFGSSRHLVVGADSATAAILASGLAGLAAPGSSEWVGLAATLALMAAALLVIARIIRLGFLADFLSRTVLVGFLSGVGIQVALGQISGMLDVPGGGQGVIGKLGHDLHELANTNPYAVAVAAAVILVVLGVRRIARWIPGALIAVIAAIIASWALNLKSRGVTVLGAIPSGIPHIGSPEVPFSWGLLQELGPTALAMFVVILAQSAATSRAYAARRNEKLDEDEDLVGLALANIGAGLSGTFIVNGSPTKTQMVESAGGCSQIAQLTASAIVLLVLLFLTGPLSYMPSPVLSAIVFLIGLELIDIKGMVRIFTVRRAEFWVALITAVVVIFAGVEQGILLAMALSLLSHVRHGYRPKNSVLVAEGERWRAVPIMEARELVPGLIVYRFNHGMYYANSEQLSEEVLKLVEAAGFPVAWFAIDATAVDDIDFTAGAMLHSLALILKQRGIRLAFVEVDAHVRAELDQSGVTALISPDAFYPTVNDLARAYHARITG